MNDIEYNLIEINEKIEEAAAKSQRNKDDITLVGVSKTIDILRIKEALVCGVTTLGENKVQEFLPKYEQLPTANWHFIGHLQTNKVKFLIGKVSLIHSVDNFKLAEQINKYSENLNIVTNILIEVNIAEEPTKNGVPVSQAFELVKNIANLQFVKLCGLMTVAPYVVNCENNRIYFKKMHNLFIDIQDKNVNNIDMKFLSMGMTNDYTVAIEEGANIVRIGTGIFGTRNYDNLT